MPSYPAEVTFLTEDVYHLPEVVTHAVDLTVVRFRSVNGLETIIPLAVVKMINAWGPWTPPRVLRTGPASGA